MYFTASVAHGRILNFSSVQTFHKASCSAKGKNFVPLRLHNSCIPYSLYCQQKIAVKLHIFSSRIV